MTVEVYVEVEVEVNIVDTVVPVGTLEVDTVVTIVDVWVVVAVVVEVQGASGNFAEQKVSAGG